MIDDGFPLSLSGIKAAAAAGRLPALARKLVFERRWSSLEVLIGSGATPMLPLADVAAAMIALCEALAELPAGDQKEAFAELADVQLHAANALARMTARTPLTEADRAGVLAAAALFAVAHDHRRAAALYERAGDDELAAELWGALGEIERMESALARLADHQAKGRRRREARAQFEALFASGERRAAVDLCLRLAAPGGVLDAAPDIDLQQLGVRAQRAADQICRGTALTLRLASGGLVRIAAVPATLGRDQDAELVLRDPTVSRQHARLRHAAGTFSLEDAGSRRGTHVAGVRLGAAVALRGAGQFELSASCVLRFEVQAPDRIELRSDTGLDRGLRALVGPSPLDVSALIGAPAPLAVAFVDGVARLQRDPALPVRVGGNLIGLGCDLLHGDVVEVAGAPAWEVV